MNLAQLIAGFDVTLAQGSSSLNVTNLTDDSRQVTPGSLFIARRGTKSDGSSFIRDALAQGAAAILAHTPPPADLLPGTAWAVAANPDQTLVSRLAERFFGDPSRRLKLIGITGTKGKTTTAFLVQHLLTLCGHKTGMIGTIWIDDGHSRTPAQLTTPGAADFSRYLAAMLNNGCTAAVSEISSHALHQGRTAALDVDAAVFTNLTGDHLDYHQTMEAYADAKAILFANLKDDAFAIANVDDPWAARVLGSRPARLPHRTLACHIAPTGGVCPHFSALGKMGTDPFSSSAAILGLTASHTHARFTGPWGSFESRLPLVGRHNVYNALAAVAAVWSVTKASAASLSRGLDTAPAVPGRLEPVVLKDAPGLPTVLVDYAHTHDALANVLSALRPFTRGKLIAVFGCGGDRDRTKRPKMAAVACRLADRVFVTSDNPRTEDPNAIIREILTGVPPETQDVHVEPDRGAAIAAAIAQASPDDVVLIAGKGHEDYQIIGTTKRHFDDREEAAKALRHRCRTAAAGKK